MSIFPCLVFTWTPLLEEDFGQERFVTDEPNVLFREGNFSRVNAIMGITSHEFISPAAGNYFEFEKIVENKFAFIDIISKLQRFFTIQTLQHI